MIKLVVCDIDCTLVKEDEIVPAEAILLRKKLEEKGVLFSLATGRVECMAERFVKEMQLSIPYVASNGATIVAGDKVLKRMQIPVSPLKSFIMKADSLNMAVVYSINGHEWYWRDNTYLEFYRNKFGIYKDMHQFTDSEWNNQKIDKLSLFTDVYDDRIKILEEDARKLDGRFQYTRYLDRSIEIVDRDASKANGVKYLAKHLGITMDEVLFCGDHQNDIELIQAAGIGVAVGNSTPEVKSVADYVAKGEYFEGVKEAVTRFVFKG